MEEIPIQSMKICLVYLEPVNKRWKRELESPFICIIVTSHWSYVSNHSLFQFQFWTYQIRYQLWPPPPFQFIIHRMRCLSCQTLAQWLLILSQRILPFLRILPSLPRFSQWFVYHNLIGEDVNAMRWRLLAPMAPDYRIWRGKNDSPVPYGVGPSAYYPGG